MCLLANTCSVSPFLAYSTLSFFREGGLDPVSAVPCYAPAWNITSGSFIFCVILVKITLIMLGGWHQATRTSCYSSWNIKKYPDVYPRKTQTSFLKTSYWYFHIRSGQYLVDKSSIHGCVLVTGVSVRSLLWMRYGICACVRVFN